MNSTVLMTTRSPTNPESSTETAALQILNIGKNVLEGFKKNNKQPVVLLWRVWRGGALMLIDRGEVWI